MALWEQAGRPVRTVAVTFGIVAAVVAAGCGRSSGGSAGTTTTQPAATVTTTAPGSTTPGTPATSGGANLAGATTTIVHTTTTVAPTTTQVSALGTVPDSSSAVLAPGDYVAFLTGTGTPVAVDGALQTPLTFDVVQFLTGKAAIDAAVAHHQAETCDGQPCVPDDYFVVNDSPRLRTILVSPDADITIVGCGGGCPDTQAPASLAQAAAVDHGYFRLTVFGTGSLQRISAIHQIFVP